MEWQQTQEEDLAFAKGCLSGVIIAIPVWVLIIMIIRFILTALG